MIRRPPRSTLFPYTTLFRSHGVRPVKRAFGAVHDFNFVDVVESEVGEIHVAAGKIHGSSIDKHFGDRKSTRLNSSHGYISYAVFCLKKKKKRIRPIAGPIIRVV